MSTATEVILPKLGFSSNEAVLVEWLAADGDQIALGQPLFSLESDKAVQEIDAPAAGTLHILAAAGDTYEVGTVLARID